jgi:DNA-binding transcriptional LysR family regulator
VDARDGLSAMDITHLQTFVAVAREGSITRASERLHLSQPAVSAHIKGMEETLGLRLFERTPRGMTLTPDGRRLLVKAEQTLAAHHELMSEAMRTKGELVGRLRLGAGSNSTHAAVGALVTSLAARFPGIEVELRHRSSQEVVAGIRSGTLDAGFYSEPGEPEPDLATIEVSRFAIHVVAAPGLVEPTPRPDWKALAALPWIYPIESACCSRTAERIFAAHRFRPRRIVGADRQEVTRTLIVSGLGVGLLHDDVAREAERSGEVVLLHRPEAEVRVLFAHLAARAEDPVWIAASSIMRALSPEPARARPRSAPTRPRRTC